MVVASDSLVGRTIVDRYEVLSLINSGGMGAVYRARQRSLNRPVAIKFIHQHLLRSAQSIQRFMVEAQTLSRLHHPHVVSVLDFGRMPDDEGGNLFLVMELLGGRDLSDVLAVEPFLPIPHIVDIVTQVLEGLSEAHHAEITHRDVKPENVILEPLRSGRHHVKLIDFGVAKFSDGRKITKSGMACGTPAYMAPEQLLGIAGPSVDIFGVGVVLFQMLTGALPAKNRPLHLPGGPRTVPDPRKIVPQREIPDDLAEVCMRAIAREPEDRFSSAQAFADAMREAMTAHHPLVAWDRPSWPAILTQPKDAEHSQQSLKIIPSFQSTAGPVSDTVPMDYSHLLRIPRTITQAELLRAPLVGRDADIDWATSLLRLEEPPPVVAFWGRTGVGRTRLLTEVAALEKTEENFIVFVTPDPAPYQEVGYRGLKQIIRALTGRTDDDLVHDNTPDRWAHMGLRMLFGKNTQNPQSIAPQRAAAAVLGWSIWRASCRCASGRVILAIDDVDKLDGASFLALREYLAGEPLAGFTALLAAEHARPILSLNGVRERALRGLSSGDAAQMLSSPTSQDLLSKFDDDIEPLYVERLVVASHLDPQGLPDTLQSFIEKQRSELTLDQRQVIHSLKILGLCTAEKLDTLLQLESDAQTALNVLIEKGWVDMQGDVARLRHSAYGQGANASGSTTTAKVLHEVAARELDGSRDLLELRAYHAIHGIADFEAFLLIEESARLRAARGDKQGVIRALTQAVAAARLEWSQDGSEGASTALEVFGRKLATALVAAGRMEQAQGVLDEILNTTEPRDLARATLLEQCAQVSELRGRNDQAERLRLEALKIAEQLADRKLAKRLRAALLESSLNNTHTHEPESDESGTPVPPTDVAQADAQQRSLLIVEDDPAIREALQSVLESEGHTVHAAANGQEALMLLRRIPHPQLILLDLMMPVMSGWDLLGKLRADPELSAIPVVVVSAAPPKGELAASRVLKKPIEVNTLLRVVEELCE